MTSRLLPTLLLAAAVMLAGCQPAGAPPVGTTPAAAPAHTASGAAAPPAPAAASAGAVSPRSPSLAVQTFDGKKFDLAQHRGKWVVVNFWATWCNPCLKEIPDLDAFDRARADVEVIGLAYEEIEHADMAAFLRQHVISYPIAVLDVYKPPADFDVPRGLPMTYLIAPDGTVARKFIGPVGSADLAAAIAAHERAADPTSS